MYLDNRSVNLQQKLTHMLMKAGCTVNEKAMRELTEFIVTQQEIVVQGFSDYGEEVKDLIRQDLPPKEQN